VTAQKATQQQPIAVAPRSSFVDPIELSVSGYSVRCSLYIDLGKNGGVLI
jgi:hypothetical protein